PDCLRPAGFPCASACVLVRGVGRRQGDAEGAALARHGLGADAAAVALGDAARDGEADAAAGAFLGRVQALERLEQLASIAHVETAAVVAHDHFAHATVAL